MFAAAARRSVFATWTMQEAIRLAMSAGQTCCSSASASKLFAALR